MLTRWLACLCMLLALRVEARAQDTGVPTVPTEAAPVAAAPTTPSDARKLYEQVNALSVVRGLNMTDDQLEQLLPILRNLREARQTALQTAAALWREKGAELRAAVDAAAAGRIAAEALAGAQAALSAFEQATAALEQANRAAAAQLEGLLGPVQGLLYESRQQSLVRQQSEARLGGAPSVQDYLAGRAEVLRGLGVDEYRLVRYWEATRLAALLRPPNAAGFPYVQARVLELLDALYLLNGPAYAAQRTALPAQIAQYLGLPAAVRPVYFTWDKLDLLLTSEQSVQVAQQLLGQTPEPVPTLDAQVAEQAQQMQEAAAQARVLRLAGDMAMTAGQLAAMQPAVQQAAGAKQRGTETQEALIARSQAALQELRDTLLASAGAPLELQQAWVALEQALQEQRQAARSTATAALVRTRDLLTTDQIALVDWPVILGTGSEARQAQLEELRGVAGQMQRAYDFYAQLRYQRRWLYANIRVARTRELLDEYLPADSPLRPQAESFVLGLVSQARTTPEENWNDTWPRLVTDLMVGLGVVPGPGQVVSVPRPVAWEDYFTILTDPQAPVIISKVGAVQRG